MTVKVLKVIHGYPPYYMAGSEVYTANFCNSISKKVDLSIFTRIEDEFTEPYNCSESRENGIRIIRVNKPSRDYTFRSKYQDVRMVKIFNHYLDDISPDIVHIGHLSHLTTQIVDTIHKKNIPIVFTLHDFWMMCIRGQLIKDDFSLCEGPSIKKCKECNMKYFTSEVEAEQEIRIWLKTLSEVNQKIDLFIAPSQFLRNKYLEYGIPVEKVIHMDYGFDIETIKSGIRTISDKIRFGYLGRVIPVKGIGFLIDSFNEIDHSIAELNIYGNLPNSANYLKKRCSNTAIHFKGGYNYNEISKVLSEIDVLIVPSIWYENSPLVIHEAFIAKIPIIASNIGGIAELVTHEKNGLLVEPRNIADLIEKMNIFIDNPELIESYSQETYVRSIQEDIEEYEKIYNDLLKRKEVKLIA